MKMTVVAIHRIAEAKLAEKWWDKDVPEKFAAGRRNPADAVAR